MLLNRFFPCAIAATLSLLTATVSATAACIADWSIAAPIVHAQGLTTVEALARIAAAKLPGIIVKTTLCEENGAFVYRILVRDAHGQLTSRTVDARAPFAR